MGEPEKERGSGGSYGEPELEGHPEARRSDSDPQGVTTDSQLSQGRYASESLASEKSSPIPGKRHGGLRSRSASTKVRRDSFSSLSAMGTSTLRSTDDHEQGRSLPLLLTAFVCVVAAISGLVVAGVHKAVLYAGCPLGINGCNEFLGMEEKGFILPRLMTRVTDGQFPESVVYIVVAFIGALLYSTIMSHLPQEFWFQMCGGGTLQSLVAVASGEYIPLRAALGRFIGTSLYLGSGGTLGGEGPAIQICTSVAMFMGWTVGIQSEATQSLLAAIGISCGFAASFNSPLAGILFAMEELNHVSPSLSKTLICCILVASVVATATIRASHGNISIFQVQWSDRFEGADDQALLGPGLWMLIAVPIGLVCSAVGAIVTLSLRSIHHFVMRNMTCWPYPALFVAQAILAASIGAAVFHATGLRGVWGIGAGSLQHAFNEGERMEVWEYFVFGAGKLVAMILAVTVRAPGDVLEPVLISGGFLGGAVGRIACYILDLPGEDIMTPCIIFGMVALFAACFRFPLTPVVIVLELTGIGSYSIILPTALASFTAITASSRICRPILDEIMHEDGIDLQELVEEAEERQNEVWVDPTVEEQDAVQAGELPSRQITPDALPRRERRPSRCFVDMEGMMNDCISRPQSGSLTPPPRSASKCSADEGLVGPLNIARHLVPRFRERSNSVSSGRSHNKDGSGPEYGMPLPGRKNSIASIRSSLSDPCATDRTSHIGHRQRRSLSVDNAANRAAAAAATAAGAAPAAAAAPTAAAAATAAARGLPPATETEDTILV